MISLLIVNFFIFIITGCRPLLEPIDKIPPTSDDLILVDTSSFITDFGSAFYVLSFQDNVLEHFNYFSENLLHFFGSEESLIYTMNSQGMFISSASPDHIPYRSLENNSFTFLRLLVNPVNGLIQKYKPNDTKEYVTTLFRKNSIKNFNSWNINDLDIKDLNILLDLNHQRILDVEDFIYMHILFVSPFNNFQLIYPVFSSKNTLQ